MTIVQTDSAASAAIVFPQYSLHFHHRFAPQLRRAKLFQKLRQEILKSPVFADLNHICASFDSNFSRPKAYREIARVIRTWYCCYIKTFVEAVRFETDPDKFLGNISERDACLANAVWCTIAGAYSSS